MNRYSRRRDPVVPKIQRVELEEGNITLRLLGVGLAIAVAVIAFGYAINSLLPHQTGWHQIEATNSATGCQSQFVLNYDLGREGAPSAEYRQISGLYTETTDRAYQALHTEPVEGMNNLYSLNTQPNTPIVIAQELYAALALAEQMDSRAVYLGPLYAWYSSLYGCSYDEEAVKFDPTGNAEAAEFASAMAAFAANPEAIQIKLLDQQMAELMISEEYLSFAKENEMTNFLDFGWMRNAFLLDAAAKALTEAGFTAGTISSYDGFTRSLGADENTANLFGQMNHKLKQTATAKFNGPMAQACFRAMPMFDLDRAGYYTYEDGKVCGPYVADDGLLRSGCDSLLLLSPIQSCAELALRGLPIYTAYDFSEKTLDGMNWIAVQGTAVHYDGSGFTVEVYG